MIPEQYQSLRKLKTEIEAKKRELGKMKMLENSVKNYSSSFLHSIKKPELPPNHYANKVALIDEIVQLQCTFIAQLALLERDISEIADPKVRLLMSLRCVDLMSETETAKKLGNTIGGSAVGIQLRRFFNNQNDD